MQLCPVAALPYPMEFHSILSIPWYHSRYSGGTTTRSVFCGKSEGLIRSKRSLHWRQYVQVTQDFSRRALLLPQPTGAATPTSAWGVDPSPLLVNNCRPHIYIANVAGNHHQQWRR